MQLNKSIKIVLFTIFVAINFSFDRGWILPGADFDQFNNTPLEELAHAVEFQRCKEIRRIVASDKSIDLNYQLKNYGNTILKIAIINKKKRSVKTLLELGADPNFVNFLGRTCLSSLLRKELFLFGERKYARLLLKHNAQVDFKIQQESNFKTSEDLQRLAVSNETVIYYKRTSAFLDACAGRNLKNVQFLVDNGADINQIGANDMETGFWYAIKVGNIKVAKYLLITKKCQIKKALIEKNEKGVIEVFSRLRSMLFPLHSRRHKIKMEVVAYLKKEFNLDYFKYPIPTRELIEIQLKYPKKYVKYCKEY